jgi:hypothetical protein
MGVQLDEYNFYAQMLNYLLIEDSSVNISFSEVTNWHSSHPYYRLNFYNNIQISQVLGIYLFFNKDYLNQFDNIIEIGSYNGGLSSYLFDTKRKDTFFISYDIDQSLNQSNRIDISFVIKDCFEAKDEIKNFIGREGRTLVICDGGHKTKEFNLFSNYLKYNDVIILHDYKQDEESWKEYTNYWQWPYGHECSYEEVKEAITLNGLKEYFNKKANFYLWGSYIKT